MVQEWNSQLANASWCQRERWHHLPYVTLIAPFQVRHSYLTSQSRSLTEYLLPTDDIIVLDW